MAASAGNWLCQAGTGKRKHRRQSLQHRNPPHQKTQDEALASS